MRKKNILRFLITPFIILDWLLLWTKNEFLKIDLCRMTELAYSALQRYYKSELKRIDLDVISRICRALDCEISDILKKG